MSVRTCKLEKMIVRTWSITYLNNFFHFVAPSCSVKTLPVASARFKISRPEYYANWLSSGKNLGGETICHCF